MTFFKFLLWETPGKCPMTFYFWDDPQYIRLAIEPLTPLNPQLLLQKQRVDLSHLGSHSSVIYLYKRRRAKTGVFIIAYGISHSDKTVRLHNITVAAGS